MKITETKKSKFKISLNKTQVNVLFSMANYFTAHERDGFPRRKLADKIISAINKFNENKPKIPD